LGTGTILSDHGAGRRCEGLNAAHPDIQLILEVVPFRPPRHALDRNASATGLTLWAVGWGGTRILAWLNLTDEMRRKFDTTISTGAGEFYQVREESCLRSRCSRRDLLLPHVRRVWSGVSPQNT